MRRILLVLLLFVAGWLCGLRAQTSAGEKDIAKKTQELEKLRNEIQAYEQKLRESEKKEKTTLERLDDLERQSTLIRRLIRRLHEQEKSITDDITEAKSSINDLGQQVDFLRTHYAQYVRSVYKNGRVYDVELFFSSNSLNQLSIRIEYLKRFSDQRARDLQSIVEKKTVLEQQNEKLQATLAKERSLLSEKNKEERTLNKKTNERKSYLSRVRSDKKLYQKEVSRKTQALQQIQKIIDDLIERERVRKEKVAAAARERERSGNVTAAPAPEHKGTFEQRRGKIRWPVSGGAVPSNGRFGRHVNETLKTVTQNPGIDITCPTGSNVVAVADGEVAVLSFIPGFGNVLILNHYNGYRTVYAHLSDVSVVESDIVKEGQVIAKSGDAVAGPVLHFEIWKDREKQDPEGWLSKQR